MQFMVIYDHPWEGSFNQAILQTVTAELRTGGHTVDVLDLHQENFDPVLRREELAVYTKGQYLDPKVGVYQARIKQADYLIFIFPVWWEVMPALLKGFIDKVFLPEWAFAEADASPLLTHIRGGVVITTMGAPQVIHTSIEPVLCKGVLEFCGVQQTRWFNLCDVGNISREKRQAWLDEILVYLRHLV